MVAALTRALAADHEVLAIDGARVSLGPPHGPGTWFLVRASNTSPVLSVRLEGRTRSEVLAARDVLAAALAGHPAVDAAPLDAVAELLE